MNTGSKRQPTWARITLLSILGYEGLGGLTGGVLLIAAPDGRYMDMPVEILRGVFPDFFIPGVILLLMGVITTYAFFAVLSKSKYDWVAAFTALWGYAFWFIVEIAIVGLHWLHAMWGIPILLGLLVALPLLPSTLSYSRQTTKLLLASGAASSLVYLLANLIVAPQWNAYDVASQTISELSAIDAPTRLLWTVLCLPYTFLVTAFGFGVMAAGKDSKAIRRCGKLLVVYGATGLLWPIAPMHLRETLAAGGGTWSDTLHLTLGGITQMIFFLAMGFAYAAFGKGFRIYTALTLLMFLIFGTLTFAEAPGVSINGPTPTIGIWERINIGAFLAWMTVLSVMLYRRQTHELEIPSQDRILTMPQVRAA